MADKGLLKVRDSYKIKGYSKAFQMSLPSASILERVLKVRLGSLGVVFLLIWLDTRMEVLYSFGYEEKSIPK